MAPAAALLKSPWEYWTYTADGGHVTHASYPAGLVPPRMGGHGRSGSTTRSPTGWTWRRGWSPPCCSTCSCRWRCAGWRSWCCSRRCSPPCSPTVAPTPSSSPSWCWPSGGGTGSAPAGGPAWRRGSARWHWAWRAPSSRRPGSACPSWSSACGWRRAGRGAGPWRVAGRYAGIVAAVFVAVDLPFIVWSPAAWVDGTLLPFAQPLVADGQGLVTLAIHGLTGGVVLSLLTVAGLLAYLALLAAFAVWFPRHEAGLAAGPAPGAVRPGPLAVHLPARPVPGGAGGGRHRGGAGAPRRPHRAAPRGRGGPRWGCPWWRPPRWRWWRSPRRRWRCRSAGSAPPTPPSGSTPSPCGPQRHRPPGDAPLHGGDQRLPPDRLLAVDHRPTGGGAGRAPPHRHAGARRLHLVAASGVATGWSRRTPPPQRPEHLAARSSGRSASLSSEGRPRRGRRAGPVGTGQRRPGQQHRGHPDQEHHGGQEERVAPAAAASRAR